MCLSPTCPLQPSLLPVLPACFPHAFYPPVSVSEAPSCPPLPASPSFSQCLSRPRVFWNHCLPLPHLRVSLCLLVCSSRSFHHSLSLPHSSSTLLPKPDSRVAASLLELQLPDVFLPSVPTHRLPPPGRWHLPAWGPGVGDEGSREAQGNWHPALSAQRDSRASHLPARAPALRRRA